MDLLSFLVVASFLFSITALIVAISTFLSNKYMMEGAIRELRDGNKKEFDNQATAILNQAHADATLIVQQALEASQGPRLRNSALDIANFNNFGTY